MQFVLFTLAQAERPTVICEFRWSENPGMNVKGGSASAGQIKVHTKEYNRLVDMGTVPARVAADHGQHCQLNHPENTGVDVHLKKTDLKLHAPDASRTAVISMLSPNAGADGGLA